MAKTFKRTTSNFITSIVDENKEKQGAKKTTKKKPKPENKMAGFSGKMPAPMLDKLRDFVYTKRRNGQFEYSQNQALIEAMNLLFETEKEIIERPEDVKEAEKEKRQRIKEGKKST